MQPCGVCGAPRPVGYVYCRSCSHYDTWVARRPLSATLRQIVVGTVLVGLVSYVVNVVADRLIVSSDEQAAARGLLLREYEDAHGELGKLREGLVRYVVRSTQAVNLCAGESSACRAELTALRLTLRQELLVFDWDAPLAFSLNEASTGRGLLGPEEVERAIDTAANFAIRLGVELTALDAAWSVCHEDGCEAVAGCRDLYAQAETYCLEYVACAAFEAEAYLRAQIIEKVAEDEAPRTKYSSSYCRDRPDVPLEDRKGVLATRTLCGSTAATEEKACEIFERLRPGLDVDRRCPLWQEFRCNGASPVSASTLAREAMPPPEPAPVDEPLHSDAPSPLPTPDDAHLVPPGGRPPHRSPHVKSDASLVPPGGGPRK